MNYRKLVNLLADKKEALGLSEAALSFRSGISQPTIHRIFAGETVVSYDKIISLAHALGVEMGIVKNVSAEDMRYSAARNKAIAIARATQALSQLEGQRMSEEEFEELVKKQTRELLAGGVKDYM